MHEYMLQCFHPFLGINRQSIAKIQSLEVFLVILQMKKLEDVDIDILHRSLKSN